MPWPWDDPSEPSANKPLFDPDSLTAQAKRGIVAPHLPSADEILARKEDQERNATGGILSTILGLPEKVFFGQAIKGAVKGGAEEGFGGAVEGFLRGTPFAFLWDTVNDIWGGEDVSRVTSFAEIRRAFGDKDTEDGWTNTAINLLGEIALSPIELFAAPFAITKVGKLAGAAKVAEQSLAEALRLGNRAGMVFKVPFSSIVFESNLGVKSGFVLPAKLLDNLGKMARANPVTKGIAKVFEATYNLPTLETGARVKQAREAGIVAKRQLQAASEIAYRQLAPETRKIAESQGFAELFTTLHEFGAEKVDFAGSVDGAVDSILNADVTKRAAKRDLLIKHDAGLSAVWDRAIGGDVEAIRFIHAKHPTIPLTPEMLAASGLTPRVGVELSDVGSEALRVESANAVMRGGGGADAITMGTAERADIATDVTQQFNKTILGARSKVADDYKKLVDDIASGKVKKEHVDEWLRFHRQQTIKMGLADIQNGFMNEAMEPFLGLYAPHIVSEAGREAIEEHMLSVFKKNDYTIQRRFGDMLAIEANAVIRDFGTHATGFVPLKEFKKKGEVAVFQRIFDMPFIRKLAKIDPQAAEMVRAFHDEDTFFRIAPVQNLFARGKAGSERAGLRALQKTAFADDSPLVEQVLTPKEFALRQTEFFDEAGEHVAVLESKSGISGLNREEAVVRYGIKPEQEADFLITKHAAEEDFYNRINTNTVTADAALEDLRQSRMLHETASEADIVSREGELLASDRMKGAVRSFKEAERHARDAKKILQHHRKAFKGKTLSASDDADLVQAYDQLRASFKKSYPQHDLAMGVKNVARSNRKTQKAFEKDFEEFLKDSASRLQAEADYAKGMIGVHRANIDAILDDMTEAADHVTAGYKKQRKLLVGERAATRRGLEGTRAEVRDVLAEIKRRGDDPKRVIQEAAIQRQIAKDGVLALDEAKKIVIDDEGTTLFDKVFARLDPNTKIKIVKRENWRGYSDFMADMTKPDALRNNSIARALDTVKQGWAAHTIYGPGFLATRVRNLGQNVASQVQAGMFSFSGQRDAAKIATALRKMLKGDMSAYEALSKQTARGTKHSLREVLDLAIENGAVNFSPAWANEVTTVTNELGARGTVGGAIKDAISYTAKHPLQAATDTLVPPVFKKNAASSPIFRVAQTMEEGADQWQRMAAFVTGLKKGMVPEQAGQSVRKWLYDSSLPLTYTERSLFRRVMPFYSFTKYALRTFTDLYVSRPIAVTAFEKLRQASLTAHDVQNPDVILPSFVTEQYGIVTSNDKDGPRVRLFGGWFNIGEAGAVADAFDRAANSTENDGGASGFIRFVMNKMHPVLKNVVEQTMNRDFYSDRPIEDFPGEQGEMFGVPMDKRTMRLVQQMRFLNELNKLNVFNLGEFKSVVNGVTRSVTGVDQMSILERLTNSAFSPLPLPQERAVNVEHESSYRQAKDEGQLREIKGRMLRRIAAPDSMPTKRPDIAALGDQYREIAAKILRRTEAASKYDTIKNKDDVRQLRRLQIAKIAGTGTAR